MSAGYRRSVSVVRNVNLTVSAGELVVVSGPNGAGKSTMLNAIAGLVRREGKVMIDDVDLAPRLPTAALELGIALVPERRQIFPGLTVHENMLLGAYHILSRRSRRRQFQRQIDIQRDRCLSLFPVLRDRLGQASGTLSGGEQQMLAISRALMSMPKVLILDEPTLGLAPLLRERVADVIDELKDDGLAVFVAEEGINVFEDRTSSKAFLEGGELLTIADAGTRRGT